MVVHASVTHTSKKRLITLAVATVLAGITATTYAQQDNAVEEVMVTGSRIRQTSGFTTPVPVTSITTQEVFNFEPGNNIARQLNALPQFFGNVSTQNVGSALVSTSGTSSLNLRSLGSNRTLVLLDGIRVVPAAKDGAVNVDAFPTALMRSVDVVTGGASAAYGADAVGGVVNFVLDREFEGIKLEAGTGINEFGDGEMFNVSVAAGKSFFDGRLNLIGSVEARQIDQIQRLASDVPEMVRLGLVQNPAYKTTDPVGTNPRQITLPWVASTASSPYGMISAPAIPGLNRMVFSEDGKSIRPFELGSVTSLTGTQSTAGGREAMISNDAFGGGIGGEGVKNQSAFFAAQYQVTDTFSVFGQFMLGRSDARSTANRGGFLLYSTWAPIIAADNAYLPASVSSLMPAGSTFTLQKNGSFAGKNEYGYDRENSKVLTTTSFAGGFDWDVGFRDWHLRGLYQQGTSERLNTFGQLWRVDRAFLSMDAVRHPTTGQIVCRVNLPQYNPTPAQLAASPSIAGLITARSAAGTTKPSDPGAYKALSPVGLDNTISGCVPHNIFGAGNMSKEALAYIQGDPKFGFGEVEQDFAELLLNGEVHEGWGAGAIGFAAGLTWRDQKFTDDAGPYDITTLVSGPRNDAALGIRGIPSGYTTAANMHYISTLPIISGDAGVWESFAELSVPLWSGELAGQDQELTTDFSFRRSDYDRSGPVDSWKFGANYQILNDLRLRYTKSRDVREPTFAELFDAQGTNGSIQDARFNKREFQITVTNGGNPTLAPEVGDTVTAGFVWTPSFALLDGLQASVDWYDVKIKDAVSTLTPQRISDECFVNKVQSLCEKITLDPVSNEVNRIFATYLNVAQARVKGVDFEVAYRMEPNLFGTQDESLSVRALAGNVFERSDTPLGGKPLDVSGGLGTPELTGVLTTNYNVGPYSVSLQGRYRNESIINTTWIEGVDVDDNTVPSYTFWNMTLNYNGETASGAAWRLGLNIQNVFDKGPGQVQNVSTRFAIQSFTGDLYGRRYNLNFNYSF